MAKTKYYVVWIGKTPGIYDNWKDCQAQISGFPNAKYKSFPTEEQAEGAFRRTYDEFYQSNPGKPKLNYLDFSKEIDLNSICVDAACSGNPGVMEYRGVLTRTGEILFHKGPFEEGTNNIGEFLAIVHALALFEKEKKTGQVIYTDSRTAMSWVKNKKAKTKLEKTSRNLLLFDLIERAEHWLREHTWTHTLKKWNTERWGEIPADFGRK
jgi:ribonuclease HI